MVYWSCGISQVRATDVATRDDRATVELALLRLIRGELAAVRGGTGDVVRYALGGGGKRLRGMLVLAAYRAAGGTGDASALAASVEIVHAYSLVHDDLPCMDDDNMRRGRPSAHVQFSVAHATFAGAAMIPLAASMAHRGARDLRLPDDACCTIVGVLMQAAGGGGMIAGQLLDLEGEGKMLSRAALDEVHSAKTGALIAASVLIGGIAAGASESGLKALERYGSCVGLSFQIMDDVLDVTSSSDRLGKTAGRDIALGKSTYPALLGIEGAVAAAGTLIDEGRAALRENGLLTSELDGLACFIVSRSH